MSERRSGLVVFACVLALTQASVFVSPGLLVPEGGANSTIHDDDPVFSCNSCEDTDASTFGPPPTTTGVALRG
jgi:hypothetical protein